MRGITVRMVEWAPKPKLTVRITKLSRRGAIPHVGVFADEQYVGLVDFRGVITEGTAPRFVRYLEDATPTNRAICAALRKLSVPQDALHATLARVKPISTR